MDKTNLGSRMKKYESLSNFHVFQELPIIARIDGRAFHTLTASLPRPYCSLLHDLMVETTCFLVKESCAVCGYTQSDEISLLFRKAGPTSEIFFHGRIQKMCSVLASMAAAYFESRRRMPYYDLILLDDRLATFDCRIFNLPNQHEILNYFVWRQRDATRNSIQMAGQAYFSHKELYGKKTNEIQDMLFTQKGVNWNDYPEFFKRGSLCKKVPDKKYIKEIGAVSKLGNVLTDEGGDYVMRSKVVRVETPIFSKENNPFGQIVLKEKI